MTRLPFLRRFGTIIPLAATLLVAGACGSAEEQTTTTEDVAVQLAPEDIAQATRGNLAPGIVVTGSLDPSQIVRIKAQVPGTVRNVRVDRGTRVRRGQVLATIEAAGIQGQAAGARASVTAAEAALAVARQRLDAAKTLREAGAMSAIDFRASEAEFEAAQAQVAGAKAQASAALESEARSTVVSPIDGYVSDRLVEGGEAVSPDAALFTVVNATTLELKGQIPVADAANVKVGQRVIFTIDAMPGKEFSGRVSRIDPMADLQTRQVGVYVQLANQNGAIVGGQYARGRIVGQQISDVVVIPETAIRGTSDATYVFVVANGAVVEVPVKLGARDQGTGTVAVLDGLQGNETLIVAPTTTLTAGTKVTLVGETATDAAANTTSTDTSK